MVSRSVDLGLCFTLCVNGGIIKNLMSEFEEFAEVSSVFSDFEKAMDDTIVTAAGKEAVDRSHAMSQEEALSDAQTDQNTIELDGMVDHALDSATDISGLVRLYRLGPESAQQSVQDVFGTFKGFIISRRNGRVEYDYVFSGFSDSDDILLSRTQYYEMKNGGRESSIKTETFTARPGDTYMNFDYVHPVRALAWLTVSHPEIIEVLDQLLIDTEGNDADKLHALKEFTYPLPSGLTEQESQMLLRCMTEYVRGMASIDYQVPYNLVIDGVAIRLQDALNSEKKKLLLKRRALFSVSYIDAYTEDVNDPVTNEVIGTQCAFALFGQMHASELDRPSYTMLMPLKSITSMASQRLEDRRRAAQLASGETA